MVIIKNIIKDGMYSMKLRMACATWIKDRNKVVLDYLEDNYDDNVELAAIYNLEEIKKISVSTGIAPQIVKSTIAQAMQQEGMYDARKKWFSDY